MAGERDRLLADALHEVAVGSEDVGAVIDDVGAELGGEVAFRNRHADRVGEPLPERAGGRLDARRMAVFRMAGGTRAELAEALDLVDRHRFVAEQMKQRIEHHRAVARREHEAVAVRPVRRCGIELEEAGEQHGGDVGGAHRQSGVARFRLLDRVHRQRPDRIGEAAVGNARDRRRARNHQERHPLQDMRNCGEIRQRSVRID